MDTTALSLSFKLNNVSLIARDSASENAAGPLYVSVQGLLELPMPPKFASKLRLESTPERSR